jgi:hypothetical protein
MIQFLFFGDSSLLRQMADSFGMTTSISLKLRESSGDLLSKSPLLPLMPHKILSFRALARNRVPISRYELTEGNLIINYLKIIIDN